ncbi:L-ribulose-5-phosphate 4-epimerase AraD [Variovorax sp. H27-G14]|uniref:L-ribulose-5-phosphate 4-epimerase AraD n=1 Tax=Variovorax sp. H27-G14 TaxID=3111914 RepID=UPI0038FBEDC5
MTLYRELKREAYEANLEIPKQALALYTFGNVSAFDARQGVFAIKPSGMPYAQMTADDMVVVDLASSVVEGSLRPSSDTKTHAVLYRAFEGIGGVCHTHSVHAVAWAQARRPIPIYGTTHADHLQVAVPVTEVISDEAVARDYEEETGHQIVRRMQGISPQEVEMIVVSCHGPFTWGKTAMKSVYNARVLEELAQMAYLTHAIDPMARELPPAVIRKHYERKHGAHAYYGQDK